MSGGWVSTRFGDVAMLVKGVSYASKDYCGPGEGLVFITIKCVSKEGGFKGEGIKYFKGVLSESQFIEVGDLLIANTDLTRAGDIVGAPMVVPPFDGSQITMSMDLSKVVEDRQKVDRRFLAYLLMTDPVRRFMKDHASGSTVLHLQTRAIPQLPLKLPGETVEQAKIAEVLSTVDRAIAQTEALIAKQQRIKTGLMQDLLTRGIDEHGQLRSEATHAFKDSPLGRIPVEWEVRTLSQVTCNVVDCPHTTPHFRADGVLAVRTFNLKDAELVGERSYVSEGEYASRISRLEPRPGDVVITREAPVGEAFVIPSGLRLCLGQRTMLVRCDTEACVPEFLVELIYSKQMQVRFDNMVGGTTNPHLNVEDVRSLLLTLPHVDEQERVLSSLLKVRSLVQHQISNLAKLRLIKTALMQDLLTGKVRVTPLLEPAGEAVA